MLLECRFSVMTIATAERGRGTLDGCVCGKERKRMIGFL